MPNLTLRRALAMLLALALTLAALAWLRRPFPAAPLATQLARTDFDASTSQIDLILETGTYRAELAELAGELQAALDAVQLRTGLRLNERLRLVVSQNASCTVQGVAYWDLRLLYVFGCAGVSRQRIVNIAAHEFVHQLARDRFGVAQNQADVLLSEGFATWGAGAYWLNGQPDFNSFARGYRDSGDALPLLTDPATVDLHGRNVLYYQWAAFVGYLLDTYGAEAFARLYPTGRSQAGSAAYAETYGRSFADLEAGWRATLER